MEIKTQLTDFAKDTISGLLKNPKHLNPKYFYDDKGSEIFRKIMRMPEYYPTNCEFEIFLDQSSEMIKMMENAQNGFDLIELGPGDGLKSKVLLRNLLQSHIDFDYFPVDISSDAIQKLVDELTRELNGIKIQERVGDFFKVLEHFNPQSSRPRVLLFLGGNIGNFNPGEVESFLSKIHELTRKGDKILIGFDLKKSPDVICKAYDDPQGFTRDFNLNYLHRINRELNADFDTSLFEHHASYDPMAGSMKSFLVSKKDHNVCFGITEQQIHFKKWEAIYMELSQKYDLEMIRKMALDAGFEVEGNFIDSQGYFADSLWVKK
ncbi:MAG: L-histidine N(alpha)-methyltransferase [Bacteroidota bacterium]